MIELVLLVVVILGLSAVLMNLERRWNEYRVLTKKDESFVLWGWSHFQTAFADYSKRWDDSDLFGKRHGSRSSLTLDQNAFRGRLIREIGLFFALTSLSISALFGHSELWTLLFALVCLVTYVGARVCRRLVVFRNRALVARVVPDFIRSIRTTDGLTSTGLIAFSVKAWTKRENSHSLYYALRSSKWLASTGHSWAHALSSVCEDLSESIPVPVVVGFKRGLDSSSHEARKFLDEAEVVASSQYERLIDVWVTEVVQVIHVATVACMAGFVCWLLV